MDLWAELLHALQLDPVPAFACALSRPRRCAVDIPQAGAGICAALRPGGGRGERWRPVLDTVESGPAGPAVHRRGGQLVAARHGPDRTEHVKTTIVRVDRTRRVMEYPAQRGHVRAARRGFRRVFGLTGAEQLPPYIEAIRRYPDRIEPGALAAVTREHLRRRAPGNRSSGWRCRSARPSSGCRTPTWRCSTSGPSPPCASAARRRTGGRFRLASRRHVPRRGPCGRAMTAVAEGAKGSPVQDGAGRPGRAVDVDDALADMADAWQRGLDLIETAVG